MIDEIDSELGAIIKKHGKLYGAKLLIKNDQLYAGEDLEEYKSHLKVNLQDVIRKGFADIIEIEIKETPTDEGITFHGNAIVIMTDKLLMFINDVVTYSLRKSK